MLLPSIKKYLIISWTLRKWILALLIPFGLLPWPLIADSKEISCAYVVLVMALFWVLEIVPLAVTALLPIFMFPLMGVLDTKTVCEQYSKETLTIFLGSLIAATAVEHCNLHHRIALRVLLIVGASPRWLLLGFMVTTAFLSMWISNSATTALMVPIVEAVILQLTSKVAPQDTNSTRPSIISIPNADNRKDSHVSVTDINKSSFASEYRKAHNTLKKALYLGICYSANVGGTGTLTGTAPNLILQETLEISYKGYNGITFASWMLFNFPGTILCTLIAWLFIQALFLRKCARDPEREALVKAMIRGKYESLGNVTFHEKGVGFIFVLMVILFFFRAPEFIPGWASIREPRYLGDAVTTIFVVVLMFIIPADPRNILSSPPLLEWKVVQEKVSWGLVILLGGGFALAEATKKSGLSTWLAIELSEMNVGSTLTLQLLVCSIALFLTEITSNTATCTIMLPIIAEIAELKELHPLLLMMPVCICCSYAFMLPIATAPNAIIFDAAKFNVTDMLIPGFMMKILCLAVIIFMINTLGGVVFKFDILLSQTNTTVTTLLPNLTTLDSTVVLF